MPIGASTDTAHVHLAGRKSDADLAPADFPSLANNGAKLAQTLRVLDAQQTAELGPCNWNRGDDVLQLSA